MVKLNNDIIFLLFEELQDDSKTLFSCLLVNRLWCEAVIPILWRDPWRYDISYQNKGSLFSIVALSLPDDIEEILTSQGVRFNSTTLQRPLSFDYLSFCRSMNIKAISDVIGFGSKAYSRVNLQKLENEIYSLIMRKCPELKYLDIRSIKLEHQLFNIPGVNVRLDSLYEFTFDAYVDYTYLYELARICNDIERLTIVNYGFKENNEFKADNNCIVKLIEAQRNLKYFEWREEEFDEYTYFHAEDLDDYIKGIYRALATKANTLTHFIITSREYTFSPEILPELHKLKTLKIDLCDIDEGFYTGIHDSILINAITCIQNSEGYLREILINNKLQYIDEQSILPFICAIYEKCPLVEYLSFAFPLSKERTNKFEVLLKTCQELRVLLFDIRLDTYDCADLQEFLKVLIRSAPIKLREIRFTGYFKIPLEALEEFLENWRGRPALSILMYLRNYGEEYMELVNRYKNANVLKDFGFVNKSDMYDFGFVSKSNMYF